MAGILGSLFGKKFPDTRKYESAKNQLISDYHRFCNIEASPLYARYLELNSIVHSGAFSKRVDELKNTKFKDTKQYRDLKRYEKLKKDRDIQQYLKFYKSGRNYKMQEILKSDVWKRFQELEKYLNTPEFLKAKSGADFKSTQAYEAFKEFKKLKKNTNIKWALKTEKSTPYKAYKKLEESRRLNEFFELKAIVESKEFREFKESMEDSKRFKKSEEAALLKEFSELKKHGDIVWYLKKKEEQPFEELKKWELTFEDNFDQPSIDANKWITGYYWGKALMNDTYVLEGENQFFKASNIELRDSCAQIITKRDSVRGKVWNPSHGFREKEFDYTSGLISTGQSFRQQYGRFEAKVRFNQIHPVVNAFWMVGERITPHIDIFKSMYGGGRLLEAGVITNSTKNGLTESTTRIKGARFINKFFIYSLDWSKEALIWKINGVEVFRETKNIPHEPMYMTFCTTLPDEPKENNLPAILEIQWVKCYDKKS
jgi:hypothetical protein